MCLTVENQRFALATVISNITIRKLNGEKKYAAAVKAPVGAERREMLERLVIEVIPQLIKILWPDNCYYKRHTKSGKCRNHEITKPH